VTIRHNTPRLHNYKTNWEKYREEITNNLNLKIKLKSKEDLEVAIETLTKVMQEAATQSTPPLEPQKRFNNIPLEMKQLLREKRKARAMWHRTHIPTYKTRYNQLTNELKAKIKEMRDASFTYYIRNLSRYDYSIWKPIKNKRIPNKASLPIRATTPITGPWARSDKEKTELFAQHFANIFTPHNDAQDHEIEINLTAPTKSHQTLACTSPKEIKEVIKSLGLKKAPGLDQVIPKILKELPQEGIVLLNYVFSGIRRTSYCLNNSKSHK
jgi:hypothetical protein